ncbi:hypothetical protein BBP40_009676 [Aspergillus hancockii]|nr:hypothetical protein BBP40_009676 [Aspergillus hancockii]
MPLIPTNEPHNYRLFGAYMNSIVTYQDSSTALLTNDDFMSRVSTTVYQKLGGVPARPLDSRGHHKSEGRGPRVAHTQDSQDNSTTEMNQRSTLERQMSSLANEPQNAAEIEEQARRQEEKEMEDARQTDDDDREREIDHLVLVTHGIGQRLGLRLEGINFIHDVNVLRKTMKNVYKASPDLQALNSAFADKNENCRVQVLPVCWRHLLDFPYRGVRHNRKELDLADADSFEDDIYPGLADITLGSVPAVRNLISDLAMDVLLYQSAYCEHISTIVKQESNRILEIFKKRNPSFRGSPLPSVKKSLWAASGQSLSIIGSRVGQSMGSLWSNFTSGVASSLLNRSLGLSSEDIPLQSNSNLATQSQPSSTTSTESTHTLDYRHPTLIDSDLETLYEGFQKAEDGRKRDTSESAGDDSKERQENEDRVRKIRIEDAKVRSLNSNGRVDYSIQE